METADAAAGIAADRRAARRRVVQYRYALLLACTFVSLGVQGIAPPGDVQQVVVAALAGSSVLLAFRAAELRPVLLGIATGLALTAVAVSVLRALDAGVDEGAARGINALLVAVGPPAVAVGIVRELRTSGHVRVEAVMGVLSLYMLLGMLFAFIYGAIDKLGGDPVFAGGQEATVSRCLYFSFTTLTTVGYGDLATRSNLGHTLSVFEALIGQIYLVTVVSLIVSNLGRPAGRGR
jgi:hypothetical protein